MVNNLSLCTSPKHKTHVKYKARAKQVTLPLGGCGVRLRPALERSACSCWVSGLSSKRRRLASLLAPPGDAVFVRLLAPPGDDVLDRLLSATLSSCEQTRKPCHFWHSCSFEPRILIRIACHSNIVWPLSQFGILNRMTSKISSNFSGGSRISQRSANLSRGCANLLFD